MYKPIFKYEPEKPFTAVDVIMIVLFFIFFIYIFTSCLMVSWCNDNGMTIPAWNFWNLVIKIGGII